MRGATVVPRSRLGPWLASGIRTPLAAGQKLQADLAAMGRSLILLDCRLGRVSIAGETDTWTDALGAGIVARAASAPQRPTDNPNGSLGFVSATSDKLVSNTAPSLDWVGGASMLSGCSKTSSGSPRLMTLYDAASGFILSDDVSGSNSRYGRISTPALATTAFGGPNTHGIVIMTEVAYTPLAKLKIQQYDSDTRLSAADIPAIPLGGSYVLELYAHAGASQGAGSMFWWMLIMPQMDAAAAALVRAWSAEQHPLVLFV